MPLLLDTNVLLRHYDPGSAHYTTCRRLFEAVSDRRVDAVVCAQVMVEYWVVATRPASVKGYGLSPSRVAADLSNLRTLLPCLPEPADIGDRWLRLVAAHDVAGKSAHDARLVALMEAHGLTRLVSVNVRDFTRYPQIQCLTPDRVLSSIP